MPRISSTEIANRRRYLEAHVAGAPRGTGCWEWPFARYTRGYGSLCGKRVPRLALELDGRPAPHSAAIARHTCDNPPCFNPSHLLWGTHKNNAEDRNGRNRQNRGEAVNTAKLTAADVRYIRSHWRPKKGSDMGNSSELGARFGVSRGTVWLIATHRKWAHIK